MDSPLRWFRRHSKIMMVVIGTFAMAIFALGNVLDSFMRPGARTQRNDSLKVALASWNGGEITRDDLNKLQFNHFQTVRFLEELQKRAFEIKKDEYRALVPPIQPLDEANGSSQIQLDEQLINRFILAKKAEKEGIVVSDGVIDEYLEMLSGGAGFSKNDLTQINQKTVKGLGLAWVPPNDTFAPAAPDAPSATLRLAWVARVTTSGALTENLRALEVYIDAGDGSVIGGDILR